MESYEVEVGGNVYPGQILFFIVVPQHFYESYLVKAIENLSGHSINLYQIHGGKSVPLVRTADQTKMEEGEYFAIETFGSTGRGRVVENVRSGHLCFAGVDCSLDRENVRTTPRSTMRLMSRSGTPTRMGLQS